MSFHFSLTQSFADYFTVYLLFVFSYRNVCISFVKTLLLLLLFFYENILLACIYATGIRTYS